MLTTAPLIVPPDYNLRPPQPGAAPRTAQDPSAQARAALYSGTPEAAAAALPSTYSEGEKMLLARSGASTVDPAIRQTISSETGYEIAEPGLTDRVLAGPSAPAPAAPRRPRRPPPHRRHRRNLRPRRGNRIATVRTKAALQRLAAVLAVLAGLWAGGAQAAIKATQVILKNGLQVVVIPDHRAPVVTHMLWYRVGGADDPMGHSGLAHFFEHMMFRGTKAVPGDQLSRIVARNGGQDNAFTTHDYTAFFERIAKDRLALVMGLEADRMVNLDLSDASVNTERKVVLEERRWRVDSDPGSLLQEQLSAALHLSHPYGRPVIGWAAEIKRIGRAEATDYYVHHYAPNNAVLIVAGDVDPAQVRALAEQKYGAVPPRPVARHADPVAPPRLAETRIAFAHPDAKLPTLIRVYRVPSYVTDPHAALTLEVLAQVLGGGPTSRLYRTLVIDQKIAVAAGAFYNGYTRGPAEFGVYAYPAPGVSFDTVEAAIDEMIQAMTAAPATPPEYSRAITTLVAAAIYERDSQNALANDYGQALSIGLTTADVEEWPERIKRVSAADVQAAATLYLIKREAATGRLSPLARR